jgi:DNA modification methylase
MQVARDTVKHCRSCDSRITVRPGNVLTCPCGNPDPVLVAVDKSPRKNIHPTVKPTELMRYLVRLVTPRGGTCLDPFCGSGSTGKGCALEWINFIGIDLDAEYTAIAERRISHAQEATA